MRKNIPDCEYSPSLVLCRQKEKLSRLIDSILESWCFLGWVGFVNRCLSGRGFEKYVERVDATLLKMGDIHPGDRYRAIGRTREPF